MHISSEFMQSAHGTIVFFNMFLLQNNKFLSDLRLRGIPQKENKHISICLHTKNKKGGGSNYFTLALSKIVVII